MTLTAGQTLTHYKILGELGDDLPHVTDTEAGVEEQRFFRADEEVGDHFLELARLIDSKEPWLELVDLVPVLALLDLGESAPRRTGEIVPPLIFAFTPVLDELVIGRLGRFRGRVHVLARGKGERGREKNEVRRPNVRAQSYHASGLVGRYSVSEN